MTGICDEVMNQNEDCFCIVSKSVSGFESHFYIIESPTIASCYSAGYYLEKCFEAKARLIEGKVVWSGYYNGIKGFISPKLNKNITESK